MNVEIQRLITCLPEPDAYADRLKEKLVGTHELTRRVGDRSIDLRITIDRVEVVHEGLGSIQYSIDQGLIQPGDGHIAFFDMGRNTAIYWLVDMTGNEPEMIWQSRNPLEAGGLHRLLVMIQKDPSFQQRIKGQPNLNLIHQGIIDGTFDYGAKCNFKDIFERYAETWLRSIKNPAFKEWQTSSAGWLDDLGRIIFVGGAAPVASRWVDDEEKNSDGWLAIAPNPQLANILGLLPKHSEGLTCVIDAGSGWIKTATNTGTVSKVESISAEVFAEPRLGEVDENSAYINYKSGPAGKFQRVVGASARKVSYNPTATVNEEKGLIAEQLILAAIGPGAINASTKTTPLRRRAVG